MSSKMFLLLAAVIGTVTGFVTIHSPLTHSAWSMLMWVIVGILLVYASTSRRIATLSGAVFGFFDIASWLLVGFQGASDQFGRFLILVGVLSVLGALCGALGGFLTVTIFRKK